MAILMTNGMFIIDEIHYGGKIYKNLIGGGSHTIAGACICSDSPEISKGIKWIVDRGSDFPDKITKELQQWGADIHFRDDSRRLTTRGENIYCDNELRGFRYLTEKRSIDVKDLVTEFGEDEVKNVAAFHLICSTERAVEIMGQLKQLPLMRSPVFLWEPLPDICNEVHLKKLIEIMHREENIILSPNAKEAAGFLGYNEPLDLAGCKTLIKKFDTLLKNENAMILRCGKHGSLSLSPKNDNKQLRSILHFPAYHTKTPNKVLDPTGGGNSYLGGFALGYVLSKGDLCIAQILGNVAAGCIVETVGVPKMVCKRWNGLSFRDRLHHYLTTYKLQYTTQNILAAIQYS
ncbi:Mak32p Ecym_1351 [Eremothecium cymbalariae DBVPG|uniref:Carbohydrate kinase PfkB domain-containing protein n=1 Tax=Eremothecium cymbalariae (strain CBS 270.75 / DBVPG 7215 / KCTC 17166 / NRRL Y-17582) TaxID=931890 RepID=G8JNC1_ERECY|nr:hypothetical protein Ecym_1351 [Eremothecium cymbalariae DBVPG\